MKLGIMDLVPSREKLDSMLSILPTEPADASMSLRSALLPLSGLEDPPLMTGEGYDLNGHSSYARIVSLLLDAFLGDRIVAKAHPWALRHFNALAIYAEEVFDLPNSSSEVFDGKTVPSSTFQQLMHKVQQITTYVLSDVGDGQSWHQKITAACLDVKVQKDIGETEQFVTGLLRDAASNDNPRDARILYTILQHILSHTSRVEGDLWMGVCRKIETKGRHFLSPFSTQRSRFLGSSLCLNGRGSLRRWIWFRTPSVGSLSQRARGECDRGAFHQDQHRGFMDSSAPRRDCPRSRLGCRFHSTNKSGQFREGLSTMGDL